MLTSSATAHAACAWVLWEESRKLGQQEPWTLISATSSESVCRARAEQLFTAAKAGDEVWNRAAESRGGKPDRVSYDDKHLISTTYTKDGIWQRGFHCLPDTVDPRGPKGK